MMTETLKNELNSQLDEAIIQLKQAQKWLRNDEYQGSSIFVGNVQNLLPRVRQKLARN